MAGNLPAGEALKGATVVSTFGYGSTRGYRVKEVKRQDGQTRLILDGDLGFVVESGGMRHVFFPLREIAGQVSYRVRSSAFVTLKEGAEVTSVGKAEYSGR